MRPAPFGPKRRALGVRHSAHTLGKTLYFFAWPTATYAAADFVGVAFAPGGGVNVTFRLYGTSAFDDSSLWTDVVVLIRNLEVADMRFGRNNAVLAAPGATMKAMGQALADLNRELAKSPSGAQAFVFTNRCDHPIRLAVHYLAADGSWRCAGWWQIGSGERDAVLTIGDGQALTTIGDTWLSAASRRRRPVVDRATTGSR